MEVGIKIICVDNLTWNNSKTYCHKYQLTIGKIYKIIGVINEFFITIVDDGGCDRNFPVGNFLTLAEFRGNIKMRSFADNLAPLIDIAMAFGRDIKLVFIKDSITYPKGRVVTGRHITGAWYHVPNDVVPPTGVICEYDDEYVIPLAEYRDKQIEEILNG